MTKLTPSVDIPLLKRPSIILIMLALLFGLPLLGAFFMAKEKNPLSTHTTNHGQLIQPPLDLANLKPNQANGTLAPQTWKGKWLLLYVNPTLNCDAACEKKLYYLRQIKTATGKNSDRVERAILTFYPPSSHLQDILNTHFTGTLFFSISKDDFIRFIHQRVPAKLASDGSIYIVDPLGNVMMVYSKDAQPMGIFKDLTRLLKLSHIG